MAEAKQWRVVHMLLQEAVNHRRLRWHSGICAGLRALGPQGLRRPSKAPLTSGSGRGRASLHVNQTDLTAPVFIFWKIARCVGTAATDLQAGFYILVWKLGCLLFKTLSRPHIYIFYMTSHNWQRWNVFLMKRILVKYPHVHKII